MPLDKEKKMKAVQGFQKHPNDTGSLEVQIARDTETIKHLTEHSKVHRKDFTSKRTIIRLVAKRKTQLRYLKKNDISQYQNLITSLKLKK